MSSTRRAQALTEVDAAVDDMLVPPVLQWAEPDSGAAPDTVVQDSTETWSQGETVEQEKPDKVYLAGMKVERGMGSSRTTKDCDHCRQPLCDVRLHRMRR